MKKAVFLTTLFTASILFFAVIFINFSLAFTNKITFQQESPQNEFYFSPNYFLPSCLHFLGQSLNRSFYSDEAWLHDMKAKKEEKKEEPATQITVSHFVFSKVYPVEIQKDSNRVNLSSLLDPSLSFKEAINYQLILKKKADQYGLKKSEVKLLSKIASCESNFRQYNEKGKILRGRKNPRVVGIFQIHEKFHLQTAEDLGLDIYKPEGNIEYAILLFKEEGIKPWRTNKKVLLAYYQFSLAKLN